MSSQLQTDIVIVGGGIAGLWLNARLRKLGYNSLLVEQHSLGGEQSVKSQGIIHGGTKYALHGALTGSSEAIADMPERWRRAIAGEGEIDLTGVRVLSNAHYLWSPGSIAGNLTSFFASKAMRGRVDAVKGAELPPALQDKKFKGKVYRLSELVLDVPSVIQKLAGLAQGALLKAQTIKPLYNQQQQLIGITADDYLIQAQRVIFCAGQGTQALLNNFAQTQPQQQLRPLHMILVKGANLKPIYAHCLGAGTKPRITITTHPAADGQWVWYLGGNLAEAEGVARNEAEQIRAAQKELADLIPWLDQSQLSWRTLRVDRAEPAQSGLVRPDNAFLAQQGKLLVTWPTKLALSPDLADRVINTLNADKITPQAPALQMVLPPPEIAQPAWETLF